jgi:hypothetical protein
MKLAFATLLFSLIAILAAPAALIAHYPLDVIEGGTATPDSTGGAGGILFGTGITVDTGQLGNAFNFSGPTNQFVAIPDAAFGRTAFTASVWFNPTTVGNGDPLAN